MKSLMLLVDRNKEHFLFQQEVDPTVVLQASWFTSSISSSSSSSSSASINNNNNNNSSSSTSGGGGGGTSSFLYSQPMGPGGSGGALVRQKSATADKTTRYSTAGGNR